MSIDTEQMRKLAEESNQKKIWFPPGPHRQKRDALIAALVEAADEIDRLQSLIDADPDSLISTVRGLEDSLNVQINATARLIQERNAMEQKLGEMTTERDALREAVQSPEVRENLARYAHEAWSGWMVYLFSKCIMHTDGSARITAASVERWKRQMLTVYEDLPEIEKQSDRAEADRMLDIYRAALMEPKS